VARLREPLGARGAHKVFTHDLQHGRAGDARQDGRLHDGQRNRRQKQGFDTAAHALILPAREATGGKPLQVHRKQQDQQDGEPEVGYGDAHLRQPHQPDITQLVVARRGIDADGQRQHRGHGHGHQRQRYGERQALEHQFQHRGAVGIAVRPRLPVSMPAIQDP
jgi:hypothetical protein